MDASAYFCALPADQGEVVHEREWMDKTVHKGPAHRPHHWFERTERERHRAMAEMWMHAASVAYIPQEPVEERFMRLADKWSHDTAHISSVTDLTRDHSYQQIIEMGEAVLPYLLTDLVRNKRFWFPALAAITELRPFDPKDMGNYRLMTEAWLRWGKRKGLI